MHVNAGLCRALAVAVLSTSVVGIPGAVSASPSLTITASSSPNSAHSELTFSATGTASAESSLYVYAQDASTGSCQATAYDEQVSSAGDASPYAVSTGSFSHTGGLEVDEAGSYVACSYLVNVKSSYQDPPDAAASSAPVTVQDGTGTCPTDLSLAVTHITLHEIGRGYSGADVVVHTGSPGQVSIDSGVSNHNLGSGRPVDEGSDNYLVQIFDTFNRQRLHASKAVYNFSYEPDADVGCTSPPQPLTVTYYADTAAYDPATQGGGGVATFGGQTVPGSEPVIADPSPAPTVSGASRVGSTDVCSLDVPRGNYVAAYAWYSASAKVGTEQTYTLPAAAFGKPLRCAVVVSSDTGTTSNGASGPVTVGRGPALKDVLRPTIRSGTFVGQKTSLYSGDWSPKPASYSYQWFANSKRIAGATAKSYRIAPSVAGKKLSCRVTALLPGYAPGVATSKPVRVSQ